MTRVDDGGLAAASLGQASRPLRPSVRGDGFRLPDDPSTPRPLAATAPAAMLDGMLAMQEAGDGAVRDREARRRGADLLAVLRRLQHALLAGADQAGALADLMRLAQADADAADPGLRAALGAVVLRARVELARRGR